MLLLPESVMQNNSIGKRQDLGLDLEVMSWKHVWKIQWAPGTAKKRKLPNQLSMCAAHLLNLEGVNSIDNCCKDVDSYFQLL